VPGRSRYPARLGRLARLLVLDEALELAQGAAQALAHDRRRDLLGEPADDARARAGGGEAQLDVGALRPA